MKRYYRDSDGSFKESASEAFLQHSSGKWPREKTKYVKIVKSPSGRDAYLYPDDLLPGKKYGPKVGGNQGLQDHRSREHKLGSPMEHPVEKDEALGTHKPVGNGAPPIAGDSDYAKTLQMQKVENTPVDSLVIGGKEGKKGLQYHTSREKKVTGTGSVAKGKALNTHEIHSYGTAVVADKLASEIKERKEDEHMAQLYSKYNKSRPKKKIATGWIDENGDFEYKKGTVAKGKALGRKKKVGSTVDLDEFLKKLK